MQTSETSTPENSHPSQEPDQETQESESPQNLDQMGLQWHRLHPSMLLFGMLRTIAGFILPIILALLATSGNALFLIQMFVLYLSISIVTQILRLFSYRYALSDGKIIIQEGILSRKVRTIPVTRIHNINTNQNLLARGFKVVRLDIETAGGGDAEASMLAIPEGAADTIQTFVRENKHKLKESSKAQSKTEETQTESIPDDVPETQLHKMSFWDVVLAGATTNRIGAFAILAVMIGQYFELSDTNLIPQAIVQGVEEASHAPQDRILLMAVLLMIGLMLLAWMLSVCYAVLRWHGFSLRRKLDDLKIKTGLFTVREYTIPLNKVQALNCRTSMIRRPFNLFEIRVRSAGHVGMQEQSRIESDMLVPVTHRTNVDDFANYVFEKANWNNVTWHPVHIYSRTLQFLGILLLITLPTVPTFFFANIPELQNPIIRIIPILLIVFAWFVAHLNWKQTAWGLDQKFVYIKKGFLSLHYWVIPVVNIQNVAIVQSPGQRRRKLGSVVIDLAGSMGINEPEIPNIPINQAWALFNRFANPTPRHPHQK